MAEAVDDGRLYGVDCGSGSSLEHGLSDQLIDPWCDPCFDEMGQKIGAKAFCPDCNSFICGPCVNDHRKSPASKKHKLLSKKGMPMSQFNKPVKYQDCEKHAGNVNDHFCFDHSRMACIVCVKAHHVHCNVSNICSFWNKTNSSVIQELKDRFSSLKKKLSTAQMSLQNNLADIECRRKAMIKEAEDLREKVTQFVNQLYLTTRTKVTDVCRLKTTELTNQVSYLDHTKHEVDKTISDIDKAICCTFGPNQFIRLQEIIQNARKYRAGVETMSKHTHKVELAMSRSSQLSGFLNSCGQLIDIREDKSASNTLTRLPEIVFPDLAMPKSISNIKKKPREISKINITKLKPLKANVAGDERVCDIWGMDIICNGHLILADNTNKSVKIVSSGNQILSSFSVASNPYQITVIDDKTAAVSSSTDSKIHILDISNPFVPSIQRSLSLGYFVYGMAVCNSNLVVTCCLPSPCVKLINLTGQELWSAAKDHDGQPLFCYPFSATTYVFNDKPVVIVTDLNKNTLTVLGAGDGALITIIDVVGKGPSGITTDDDGNVYVCYNTTRELGVFSADLKQCRHFLSGRDIRNIVYSNISDELFVGIRYSDLVDRLKLS